jgi:ATP-dependent RNA helicase RhlE
MKPGNEQPAQSSTFKEMGVNTALLNVLEQRNITQPTPIQHQSIPLGLEGKDLIGIAQTGTGKTFAFGLPLLQQLAGGKKRGLILLPTRELAYQVEEALKPFASALGIRTAVFVGGASMNLQCKMLKQNPRVLIATPGRLNDHLQRRTVSLDEVEVLVLDEADRMLDMGFKPQINSILAKISKKRQTLLFSATMPQEIFTLAKNEMHMPLRIEVAPEGTTASKVVQELIIVKQPDKKALLITLLKENEGQVLVFSRTKHGAKKITRELNDKGVRAAEIHSNKSLAQRRAALDGFKRGKFRVLVATDIASRGIDVDDITLVVNFDLPDDAADYVHRIGRTARAGRSGKAISLATPTQAGHIRDIERLIRGTLPRKKHASLPDLEMEKGMKKGGGRPPRRPDRRSNARSSGSRPSRPSSRNSDSRKPRDSGGRQRRGR